MELIHHYFEQQVERTPDRVALRYANITVSYAELNQRANQVAHYLRRQGVGPETLVGLALERSPEMVVGLLGILKAGGAFLPLDPSYPPQRLAYMLVDSRVRFVMAQAEAPMPPVPPGVQAILLDHAWEQIAQESSDNPVNLTDPDNLLYALYTSGSTGRPKGVAGTHRATLNRLQWMAQAYPFEADEVCCQKTPLSFVDSVAEIFSPLLAGIPSVIVPDEQVKDPFRLVETLAAEQISRIVVVPSLLHAALEAYEIAESSDMPLVAPRLWVCSGEALPPDLALRFREVLPHSTLLNLYGSSEVAADITCYNSTAAPAEHPALIGTPIDGVQLYVLDEQLQPVTEGGTGELYVGGVALARGYLNCPTLTAARFIPNPFGAPDSRLYRTGDLVRRLPDGDLEFVGRVDQQVKLRGMRIELGEIESRLRQHEWIADSAVMLHEDSARGGHLVAYVVLAQSPIERDSLHHALYDYLQADLPAHMIPSEFVALESFPRTPNGKLDRKALKQARRHSTPDLARIAPQTPIENLLAQLWAEVFAVPQVGLHSDFFELGGHSLLAAQIVARLRERLNVPLDVRDVFEYPTVSLLSQRIQTLESAESHAAPVLSIQPIPRLLRR